MGDGDRAGEEIISGEGEADTEGEEDFLIFGLGDGEILGEGDGKTLINGGVVSFDALASIESILSQTKPQVIIRPIRTPDFIKIERFILLSQSYHNRSFLATRLPA